MYITNTKSFLEKNKKQVQTILFLQNKIYKTNYHLGALAIIKGNYYYNYKTKKYQHWKEVSKRVDF